VDVESVVDTALLWLGVGFLAANAYLLFQYARYAVRRRRALLVWAPPAQTHPAMGFAIAGALALLIGYKLVLSDQPVFGEAMMLLYYGGLVPLSRRIARGFYQDGIWANRGFVPYSDVGGISWRETPHAVSLLVTSRSRSAARRLAVPVQHYAAARRILGDRMTAGVIRPSVTGLGLDASDPGPGPSAGRSAPADNPPGVSGR
jgi:hypothetical protein